MSLFFPDTSTLISLFDESEPLHSRAKDVLRDYKVRDIFIPMNVMAEWQARVMREHDNLKRKVIMELDRRRFEGVNELTNVEFNILVEQTASAIKSEKQFGPIEPRKLDRAKSDLLKEISKAYRNNSGSRMSNKAVEFLKSFILNLKYVYYDRGVGVLGFFIHNGYVHPDISKESEEKVKKFISENRIELKSGDAMILSELIRYAVSDSEKYDFVVGDKKFFRTGKNYVELYDGLTARVNFIYLARV